MPKRKLGLRPPFLKRYRGKMPLEVVFKTMTRRSISFSWYGADRNGASH